MSRWAQSRIPCFLYYDAKCLPYPQHVKARGFCNHNSFTGVGVAVPDRLNLLRIQVLIIRGVQVFIAFDPLAAHPCAYRRCAASGATRGA